MTTLASRPQTGLAQRVTLRTAFKVDAVVTGANGAAYLIAAGPLGELLGIAPALLRGIGVVLLGFSAALLLAAMRHAPARPAAIAVIAVNAAWAISSIVVACAGWMSPSTLGAVWIVAQALVVAGFAELQAMALKAMTRDGDTA